MGYRERPVDCKEFEKLLRMLGFELDRQKGTSHAQWEHPCFKGKRRLVSVSRHHSPFARSLLKDMRNQMGLSKKEFFRCLEDESYARKLAQANAPTVVPSGSR